VTQPTFGSFGVTHTQPAPQPAVDTTAPALAKLLLGIIQTDRKRLERIDRYVDGCHDDPYMPIGADAEYQLLAKRAVSNWIPLLVNTPAQALYVDSFRRGTPAGESAADDAVGTQLPEWQHWQQSRLDARQIAVHRGALKYGHSFTVTEKDRKSGKVQTKGLSALHTAAVYEDPANDIDPFAALTVTRYPNVNAKTAVLRRGAARLWDRTFVYDVTFESLSDLDSVRVARGVRHGLKECPITRFTATVDLEGRTTGVVEPNISVQDRINQTVFDLLVAQTYGSFKVRTVTGMAPPMLRWTPALIEQAGADAPQGVEAGDPVIDPDTGKPIPEPVNLNARRFFFAEDENVKFGVLDETPLDGYIKSLDMSIRQLAAMTQTPPHYLLGEIANLSAEALQAAETSLLRKVEEYRKSFGESWERVFRIAATLSGDAASANDFAGEVMWRDTEMRSLAATADALVKLKELGIPLRGLWNRVPETTRGEIEEWLRMRREEVRQLKAAQAALTAQQEAGSVPVTPQQMAQQTQITEFEVAVA